MTEVISRADFLKLSGRPKASKYRNKAVWVGDLRFDSKREAKRWCELRTMAEFGFIKNLRRQVLYPLHCNGRKVTAYKADFVYETDKGELVTEDAKGVRTPEYILKRKMMVAEYGITIKEV